mmetsp:Transcript_38257/g.95071  ORF Transcript_38257/g.95071 Transcript_38257/m.95071 type:complete len:444 (-) Transcript_38257:22-1353(-)
MSHLRPLFAALCTTRVRGFSARGDSHRASTNSRPPTLQPRDFCCCTRCWNASLLGWVGRSSGTHDPATCRVSVRRARRDHAASAARDSSVKRSVLRQLEILHTASVRRSHRASWSSTSCLWRATSSCAAYSMVVRVSTRTPSIDRSATSLHPWKARDALAARMRRTPAVARRWATALVRSNAAAKSAASACTSRMRTMRPSLCAAFTRACMAASPHTLSASSCTRRTSVTAASRTLLSSRRFHASTSEWWRAPSSRRRDSYDTRMASRRSSAAWRSARRRSRALVAASSSAISTRASTSDRAPEAFSTAAGFSASTRFSTNDQSMSVCAPRNRRGGSERKCTAGKPPTGATTSRRRDHARSSHCSSTLAAVLASLNPSKKPPWTLRSTSSKMAPRRLRYRPSRRSSDTEDAASKSISEWPSTAVTSLDSCFMATYSRLGPVCV